MQDLVNMYDQLQLKNEFLEALGNLTIMTLETGDYNAIKELLFNYGLLECNQKVGEEVVINKEESLN